MRRTINAANPGRLSAAFLISFSTLGGIPSVNAESVYKSVDAQGNITYSATPPAEAVETTPVKVEQGPSDARKREAAKLERELQRSAKSATNTVNARREQRMGAAEHAKQSLTQAQKNLEQARIQQPGDWQGQAGGGRRLKPSYFERVEKAQAAVETADNNLSKARRDAR